MLAKKKVIFSLSKYQSCRYNPRSIEGGNTQYFVVIMHFKSNTGNSYTQFEHNLHVHLTRQFNFLFMDENKNKIHYRYSISFIFMAQFFSF